MEHGFFLAAGLLLAAAGLGLAVPIWPAGRALSTGFTLAGGLVGALWAGLLLATPGTWTFTAAWSLPLASWSMKVDPLAAFFLLIIFAISALAALYGHGYQDHASPRVQSANAVFFNLLVVGMALVVAAANGVLFLLSWELMSFAAYFLVVSNHRDHQVREAGFVYLLATYFGTACLLAMFWLLDNGGGNLDFDRLSGSGPHGSLILLLALLGFGAKAGLAPLHIWLPEAHPAAPSHVSAVMSAVMIKTGIYGLLRVVQITGTPSASWGVAIAAIGLVTALLGILFALGQRDMKRLLAYSSVENIGIILLGLGIGMAGQATGRTGMAMLGYGGALLHVLNHAVCKSLLFLGAGCVLHATGTRDIEKMGGLLKRLPQTGGLFLFGLAALAALPPLNGFVGEFLIYFSASLGLSDPNAFHALLGLAAIVGLGIVGALTLAVFTKVFGIAFLGEPRQPEVAAAAHEAGLMMRAPMWILALLCPVLALISPWLLPCLVGAIQPVCGIDAGILQREMASWNETFRWPWLLMAVTILLLSVLGLLRRWLRHRQPADRAVTWDCGYAAPSARMQYTAASFAQPLLDFFEPIVRLRQLLTPPRGLFPAPGKFATEANDPIMHSGYGRLFHWSGRIFSWLHWVQHGHLTLYLLYMTATLVILLLWFGVFS